MSYEKQTWEDLPSQTSPFSAERMNHIEEGISAVDTGKLDKMTEGTWTPEINTVEYAKPTVTYTEQTGKYIRVGDMVWVSFFIKGKITALNGTDNYTIITGLPYVVQEGNFGHYPLTIGQLYDLIAENSNANLVVNSNIIRVQRNYGAGSTTLKVTSGSYFIIAGSGWYPIKK